MRIVDGKAIIDAIRQMAIDANYRLSPDIYNSLKESFEKEISPIGKGLLGELVKNADIAREGSFPICQDTGMAIVFMEIGQDVHIEGGSLMELVNEGVRQGYDQGFLRKSVVSHPLKRKNTGDNTPAVLHTEIVPGDRIKIHFSPKGFGSENMSAIKMLNPSDGEKGVMDFVVETVEKAGSNPCPPIVVGVGIGGTFEKAAYLAKKALLRPINQRNADPTYAKLEEELLELVNKTGVGPQGLGGVTTALGVNVEYYPTHIAGMPAAININCHATRHAEITL